jgi:TolB-like protein
MRRSSSILSVAVMAALAGLIAAPTQGQTFPSDRPADRRVADGTILVLPFVSARTGTDDWIGKAVQQDLLTDLTQGATTHVVAPAGAPAAADVDGAIRAARDAGASIVVFGQAQSNGKEVRLTGQVIDSASGKSLGALKATGPTDELFHLEDALAGQVFYSLPRGLLTAQTLQGLQAAANNNNNPRNDNALSPDAGQTAAPVGNGNGGYSAPADVDQGQYQSPSAYYSYPSYQYNNYYQTPDYGSYYPDYGYYSGVGVWPYWSTGIFFNGGYGYRHHWNGGWNGNGGSRRGDSFRGSSGGFTGVGTTRGGFSTRAAPSFSGGIRSSSSFGASRGGGFSSRGFSSGGIRGGGGAHGGGGGRR